MTFSIPNDITEEMRKHPEIKWSEVARQAIIKRLEDLELLEKIASKSKLSLEDAEKLAEKIKKRVWARHLKLLGKN